MAKRTAGKTGNQKKNTTPAKKRAKKAAPPPPKTDRLWSVALFAVALLVAALAFLPGQAAWSAVRGACFGVFGWGLYLLIPALLYIAVLVAAGRRYKAKAWLCALLLLLVCGTALVFSRFEVTEGQTFSQLVKALYDMGVQHQGGGVCSLPLGLSLLCWTGRPAANILLVIVLLALVMVLTDITPADIVDFIRRKSGQVRDSMEDTLSERDQRRAARQVKSEQRENERQAKRRQKEEQLAAERQGARQRPPVDPQLPLETLDKPRDRWNIDVNLNEGAAPATPAATAPLPPLEGVKGQAFDPKDHSDLADALEHDLLTAAGREALHPQPPKTPETAENPFVSDMQPAAAASGQRHLFDQDAESAAQGPATRPAAQPVTQTAAQPTTQAAAQSGSIFEMQLHDGEIGPNGEGAEMGVNIPATKKEGTSQNAPRDPSATGARAAALQDGQRIDPQTAGVAQAQAQTGDTALADGGEIDDLIRRALDGRPLQPDATQPDGPSAAAPQPSTPGAPPYHLPSVGLLDRQPAADESNIDAEMREKARVLVATLESFRVKTEMQDICRGPSVTRYELKPAAGVKISSITNLADDIALNLAAAGVRIEAPVPGKPVVGIELPNKTRTTVSLRSLLQSPEFAESGAPLTMCLGRDIAGSVKLADLAKMPHMLIAGSTGSGKSVCINSIIMSFLFKSTPEELRMILIDPKVVELAVYNGIPHLLMPVVTEPRKAAGALGSAVAEMERRYQLFAAHNVRDIKSYNNLAAQRPELEHIPYIAIVIDELADLMMVAGKEVEDYICRIAQKARAAGMHLIVATQRPSVDVITGLIKANIPSRVAFAVSSQIDSRTILDTAGAEKLLGMGDMLFLPVGANRPVRIQGTFVKDSEIERVIEEIKSYADSRYDDEMMAETDRRAAAQKGGRSEGGEDDAEEAQDPLLPQAIELVVEAGMASTSWLQRRLKLGYARAGRIMDEMEQLHVVGPSQGSKPREVLLTRDQYLEMSAAGRFNAQ